MMEYIAKTSAELSEKDFSDLAGLFNHVFNRNIEASLLKQKYNSPHTGFSYHGLMYSDSGSIVGALTFIPFTYSFYGIPVVMGSAADLMIHENYRKDLLSVKRMYDLAMEKSANTLDFLYAIPNSNAYLYWTKFLKWQDIGRLDYYVQILNISKIRSGLRGLDWLSGFFSASTNYVISDKEKYSEDHKYPIYKLTDEAYMKYRFEGNYSIIGNPSRYAYYSIVDEDRIKTAYIIDIFPSCKGWLGSVVKEIYTREKRGIDIIIYISSKIITPVNLLKVPRRFEPRSLDFIGKILSSRVDDRIYNIDNWFFNLSNFDVR